LALRDIPSGLIVPLHRDLEALPNQVRKICEPLAVLAKALLVESSALVEHYGFARIGKSGKHSCDID
jgi:hypothetical protein